MAGDVGKSREWVVREDSEGSVHDFGREILIIHVYDRFEWTDENTKLFGTTAAK